MGRMSLEEVWGLLVYCGDALIPGNGQNDLHVLAVEAVHRLPPKVQTWLLAETSHVFIGGHGQRGEFIELGFPPREVEDGFVKVRLVFLSEQLMSLPADEALWTIAREIGYSWQDHRGDSGTAAEVERLAKKWGFAEPQSRAWHGPETVPQPVKTGSPRGEPDKTPALSRQPRTSTKTKPRRPLRKKRD
jgi:hypothetical protein